MPKCLEFRRVLFRPPGAVGEAGGAGDGNHLRGSRHRQTIFPPPGGRLARPASLAPSAPPTMLRQVMKRNNCIRKMATPEPLRSVWRASWTLGSEAFRN